MQSYIHIPFCQSKCPYCAFGSITKFDEIKRYFEALKFELSTNLALINEKLSTVFIGGGTPSVVEADFYEEFFLLLREFLQKDYEMSIEANPNSSSLQWLTKMREFGVNRVSFGAQSFNQNKLKLLGRTHSVKDISTAVQNAKLAGFDNINVDIMYATKFDTKEFIKREASELLALDINHISAYWLTLEENTPFYQKTELSSSSVVPAKTLFECLKSGGFLQYEISNFAKEGSFCRHNLGYWQGEEYLGFGAHGVGFLGKKNLDKLNIKCASTHARLYSPKILDSYIKNPLQKDIENLSTKDLELERLFLGFRSMVGVWFNSLNDNQIRRANELIKSKKLKLKDGKIFASNYLIADELALYISE